MEIRNIEDIAYVFKKLKEKPYLQKPIIFLGAGASASAGIPLASQIIQDVLIKYSDKPSIINLPEVDRRNYYSVMSALSAQERRKLFQEYIRAKNVKLSVTYIYLAQFLKEGLVDFVLTVNFDDLLLKASALYNFIPPVYDISILNELTTTNFEEKSLLYLHGQHHGQWLLNSKSEIVKVKETVKKIFNRICHNRTWIIIGYSGEDEILDEISNIGSFQNDLYWIGYKRFEPTKRVESNLLQKPNANAYLVQGYDSDSFFLKLHSELQLDTPEIFNQPFSFLNGVIDNIKDFDHNEYENHQSLFKNVRDRMDITKSWVSIAIRSIESKPSESRVQQEIIEAYLKKNFSEEKFHYFNNCISDGNLKKDKLNLHLSTYLSYWGDFIHSNNDSNNEAVFNESLEKYKLANTLAPNNSFNYFNWGNLLSKVANLRGSKETYYEAFEKYNIASNLTPINNKIIYHKWAIAISELAKITLDASLYKESIEMLDKAYALDNANNDILIDSATILSDLAKLNNDEGLFQEAFKRYKSSSELRPNDAAIYYNWGFALADLAILKKDKPLFKESISKYEKAIEINKSNGDAQYNLAWTIYNYSTIFGKDTEEVLLERAKEIALNSYKMVSSTYLLGAIFLRLNDKENALKYFEEGIVKGEITLEEIKNDDGLEEIKNTDEFKKMLERLGLNL